MPFSWPLVALCALTYALRMFAITAGYHRYFSHRSFRTGRVFQFVLAVLGASSLQKGPLWWAAHHRHHHLHSDDEHDLHSPEQDGFWWSHIGWILSDAHNDTDFEGIPDFARFPELRWLNRYHAVPGILLAVVLFVAGGWPAVVWGFFVSTVLLWHATFSVNSLCHLFGRKRFATSDDSRNNWWMAIFTLGEGWHNNHHHYMASARQGFFWWEIDVSYYTLRLLSVFGVVWGLRQPPKRLLARADSPAPEPSPASSA